MKKRYPCGCRVILAVMFFIAAGSGLFAQNREEISLDGRWLFCPDKNNSGEQEKWYASSLPQKESRDVDVPHAWNADKGMEKYWGKCWYQRDFIISSEQQKKILRFQFDAVYHDAFIYINGVKAGEHIGCGYTRFFTDITSLVKAGRNTITLCVDNSPSRSSVPFLKSFDWPNDGGIFRSVKLIITSRQAIANVKVNAIPDGKKGTLDLSIDYLNPESPEYDKVSVRAKITEENQPTRNEIFNGILNGERVNRRFVTSLHFKNINPWHFDSPNLYRMDLQLVLKNKVVDEYSVVFGFRSISVSGNRYILNGEPVRLVGMEWTGGENLEKGMAQTRLHLERGLSLMKEANCVFARCHWQQDEYFFDWCDRHGILVQEEVPLWGWETILNDTLRAIAMQQLDEMTEAHYNHPSIIIWGLGNELQSHKDINITSLDAMAAHARLLDSNRLITYVTSNLDWGFPADGKSLADASTRYDMVMFNEYYSSWFGKSTDSIIPNLEKIHKNYPENPVTISEWGICEPVFKGGDERRRNEMKIQLEAYGSQPYVAGAIYFCLNDYRTHMGEDTTYGYPQRVHGICDIHLNKKPSFDTLKKISSPLIVRKLQVTDQSIRLTLGGNTGIPSYTVRNYQVKCGTQSVTINELKPGETQDFNLRPEDDFISIIRPTGFEVLRLEIKKY